MLCSCASRLQYAQANFLACTHDVLAVACHFSFSRYGHHQDLHSFPTRRSSDLLFGGGGGTITPSDATLMKRRGGSKDRKSTRLNSSHRCISYAVFCLKKKIRSRWRGSQLDGVVR